MQSSDSQSRVAWDYKRYPKAPPYDGRRGAPFLQWERDLVAGIADLGDDECSLEDTMYGVDPGGDAPGAPVANAAAQRRRANSDTTL